jgi:SAM-dependent methyltransferase
MMNKVPEHLGGHMNKTHTDEGVLTFMRDTMKSNSMVDIGCGPGGQVELARSLGYETVIGIDGDWSVLPKTAENICLEWMGESTSEDEQKESPFWFVHDFSEKPASFLYQPYVPVFFDLAWSVEFLEHVEEQYIPNYMPIFQACKYAIVTHAVPGQDGHHHVNCQEKDYWVDKFREYDMIYQDELTVMARDSSTMKKPFIKRTGLVFQNRGF